MANGNTKTNYRAALKAAQRADDRIPHIDDRDERIDAMLTAVALWMKAAECSPDEGKTEEHLESAEYRGHQIRTLHQVFRRGSCGLQSRRGRSHLTA